jgi:hypothetical protein
MSKRGQEHAGDGMRHPQSQPAEPTDIASELVKHLQVMSNGGALLSSDDLGNLADDQLSAALHDAAASNIDDALAQLTVSPNLFDMPVLDFSGDAADGVDADS